MTRNFNEKLIWANDPLLAVLRFKFKLSSLSIWIIFFGLFCALVFESPILPAVLLQENTQETLRKHFHILIGYPLFVCNVVIALQYYSLLPSAFRMLLRAGFIHDEDVKNASADLAVTLRKMKRWVKLKDWLIYGLSVSLVGALHAAYLSDDQIDWLETSDGKHLSSAGWLNALFIAAIISIALQFTWSVMSTSFLLHRIKSLVTRGKIRINPWRLNLHRALRPTVTLFWLSCATLLPLFVFSILQAVIVRDGDGDVWHWVQMWIFFPIVYLLLTPLMILGHLYPIYFMIASEKTKMLDYLSHNDSGLLPTNAAEFAQKHGWRNYKQRIKEIEIHDKLFAFIEKIPVLPVSLKKALLLLLPPVVDFLVKHLVAK